MPEHRVDARGERVAASRIDNLDDATRRGTGNEIDPPGHVVERPVTRLTGSTTATTFVIQRRLTTSTAQ